MVSDDKYLSNIAEAKDLVVRVASGATIPVTKKGDLVINGFVLEEVLVEPQLVRNLLSVSALSTSGYHVKFAADRCLVRKEGVDVLHASISNGVYVVCNVELMPVSCDHERFGHIGSKKMKLLGYEPLVEKCKGCVVHFT